MAALVQVLANSVLDAIFDQSGASVRISTGPMKLRLMSANGNATSAGTELSTSGGYTAGGSTVTMAAAASGSKSSNADVTWTNMPAVTIVGVEVWDSAGTPLRKMFGALSSNKTTNAGDTFTVTSGSLTASAT